MKLSKSVVSRLKLVSNTRATTEYWSRYVAMTHLGWGRKVQTTKLWNSKIHISLAGGRGEGKRREKQRLTLFYKSKFHAKRSLLYPPLHFSFVALLSDPPTVAYSHQALQILVSVTNLFSKCWMVKHSSAERFWMPPPRWTDTQRSHRPWHGSSTLLTAFNQERNKASWATLKTFFMQKFQLKNFQKKICIDPNLPHCSFYMASKTCSCQAACL